MKSLSRDNQADIIEVFNTTTRYLDDVLNIDNIYFGQMVDRIYPTELQLNGSNSSDTEAPFFDLNLLYVMVQFPQKFMIFWFWYIQFPSTGRRCPPAYLIWDIHISTY